MKHHKTFLITTGTVATMAWAVYNGSQGYRELMEKRQQVREMEEQNSILEKENEDRRNRIERLNGNSSEEDMELRKLNLAKPGETVFILRNGGKTSAPSSDGKSADTPAVP